MSNRDQAIIKIVQNLDFDSGVLLVIDVQNDFCHDQGVFAKMGLDLSHIQEMIPRLKGFIERVRQTPIPIIFVKNIND